MLLYVRRNLYFASLQIIEPQQHLLDFEQNINKSVDPHLRCC